MHRIFRKGDRVNIPHHTSVGEIVTIRGNQAQVAYRTLLINLPLSQLEHAPSTCSASVSSPHFLHLTTPTIHNSTTLDLHGLLVSEALVALDRFIDQALLVGHQQLKVIHGKGTGTLRNAVHTYIKSHSYVKQTIAPPYLGGEGVTFITL